MMILLGMFSRVGVLVETSAVAAMMVNTMSVKGDMGLLCLAVLGGLIMQVSCLSFCQVLF